MPLIYENKIPNKKIDSTHINFSNSVNNSAIDHRESKNNNQIVTPKLGRESDIFQDKFHSDSKKLKLHDSGNFNISPVKPPSYNIYGNEIIYESNNTEFYDILDTRTLFNGSVHLNHRKNLIPNNKQHNLVKEKEVMKNKFSSPVKNKTNPFSYISYLNTNNLKAIVNKNIMHTEKQKKISLVKIINNHYANEKLLVNKINNKKNLYK